MTSQDDGLMSLSPPLKQDPPAEVTSPPDKAQVQPADKETADLYRFIWPGTLEYPHHGNVVASFGDEMEWPDGPPNDGHWVPVETKE